MRKTIATGIVAAGALTLELLLGTAYAQNAPLPPPAQEKRINTLENIYRLLKRNPNADVSDYNGLDLTDPSKYQLTEAKQIDFAAAFAEAVDEKIKFENPNLPIDVHNAYRGALEVGLGKLKENASADEKAQYQADKTRLEAQMLSELVREIKEEHAERAIAALTHPQNTIPNPTPPPAPRPAPEPAPAGPASSPTPPAAPPTSPSAQPYVLSAAETGKLNEARRAHTEAYLKTQDTFDLPRHVRKIVDFAHNDKLGMPTHPKARAAFVDSQGYSAGNVEYNGRKFHLNPDQLNTMSEFETKVRELASNRKSSELGDKLTKLVETYTTKLLDGGHYGNDIAVKNELVELAVASRAYSTIKDAKAQEKAASGRYAQLTQKMLADGITKTELAELTTSGAPLAGMEGQYNGNMANLAQDAEAPAFSVLYDTLKDTGLSLRSKLVRAQAELNLINALPGYTPTEKGDLEKRALYMIGVGTAQ